MVPSGPIDPDAAQVESASMAWCPLGAGAQSRRGDVTVDDREPRPQGSQASGKRAMTEGHGAPCGERPGQGFGTSFSGRPCLSWVQRGVPELPGTEQAGHGHRRPRERHMQSSCCQSVEFEMGAGGDEAASQEKRKAGEVV